MFSNFINAMKSAADSVRDIEFFRIIIPILAVIGPVLFIYFGLKGIIKKETTTLFRNNIDHSLKSSPIKGTWAILIGFIYIATGIIMAFILLPFAWVLTFG